MSVADLRELKLPVGIVLDALQHGRDLTRSHAGGQ